jgi:RNA recognition motif-containing protein
MHLYISNLSLNISEEELREIFSWYGNVSRVEILRDPVTNSPIGGAIVTMPQKEQAEFAVAKLNLTKIKERTVLVSSTTATGNRRARSRVNTADEAYLKITMNSQ